MPKVANSNLQSNICNNIRRDDMMCFLTTKPRLPHGSRRRQVELLQMQNTETEKRGQANFSGRT